MRGRPPPAPFEAPLPPSSHCSRPHAEGAVACGSPFERGLSVRSVPFLNMDAKPRTVTLTHFGRQFTASVRTERYIHGGGLAVELFDESDGEPYATVSVNVE